MCMHLRIEVQNAQQEMIELKREADKSTVHMGTSIFHSQSMIELVDSKSIRV